MALQPFSPQSFSSFGDLLKYLRRRERLTQFELSIAVGYSEAQISRLEKNQRPPDLTALKALFVPALHLEDEPEIVQLLFELARSARQEGAPAPGMAPYKGLLFFEEADSDLFFGREALTTRLVSRVKDLAMDASTRALAIVGASGSGKSSLVRAGLAVALKREGWKTHVNTPTSNPLKALDTALDRLQPSSSSPQLLLVVDQFEEAFTLAREESERAAFIDRLLQVASNTSEPVTIVIALRADFYAHCAQYLLLRQAIAAQQEYIGQMTAEELRRAIEEPARRGGWVFEPGLVDVLLQDIGADGSHEPEPGALPLLSHALLAIWERRRGRMFTLDGYHASGGVRGAIAETAESVFADQLDQGQQGLAREIFLRLAELGEGTEDTRRRAALSELMRQSHEALQLRAVLNTLAEARLITLNEDSAEVAHEALIREWQRLREWLHQDREGLMLHRHLTEAVHEWESRGRDPNELYRGARLAQAREWALANEARLNDSERTFLQASVQQEEHDLLEREAQRRRELEAARRLAETERARVQEQARSIQQLRQRSVYLIVVLAAAVLVAILAGNLARQNGSLALTNASVAATAEAEAEARATQQAIAQENFTRAEAQRLAAEANVLLKSNASPELIALLSSRAMSLQYSAQGDAALSSAAGLDYPLQVLTGQEYAVPVLAISPDGKLIAATQVHDPENITHLWEVESGKEIRQFVHGPNGQGCCGDVVDRIAFSPNGHYLLTHQIGDAFRARIWDVHTGQQVFQLTQPAFCNASAFSADGNSLLIGCDESTVLIWDWRTNTLVRTLTLPLEKQTVWAISKDGEYALSRSWWWETEHSTIMRLWRLRSEPTQLSEFVYPSNFTDFTNTSVMVSSDCHQVLVGDLDGTTHLLDAAGGKEIRAFKANGTVLSVDFAPDGSTILASSQDQMVRLYDWRTGQELHHLSLADYAWVAAFSPDGRNVVTGSDKGTIRVWKIDSHPHLPVFASHAAQVAASFSPDGQLLATGGLDGLHLWQTGTGQLLHDLADAGTLSYGAEFSPDGQHLLSGNVAGTATLWDVATGLSEGQFVHPSGFQIYDVAFSPDGRSFLTAGWGGDGGTTKAIWIWDVRQTEAPKLMIETGRHPVFQAVFSPDGKYILGAIGNEPVARLWDASSGALVREFTGHADWIQGVAFSPDGKSIATASNDDTARLWDLQTGREIRQFLGHTELVSSVAFSPAGNTLATSSADGTARLWDLQTGKELRRLAGHTAGVENVAFSPDGKFIATVSDDGTARLWDVDFHETMRYLCSRLRRDFTEKERAQYGIVDDQPTCSPR